MCPVQYGNYDRPVMTGRSSTCMSATRLLLKARRMLLDRCCARCVRQEVHNAAVTRARAAQSARCLRKARDLTQDLGSKIRSCTHVEHVPLP